MCTSRRRTFRGGGAGHVYSHACFALRQNRGKILRQTRALSPLTGLTGDAETEARAGGAGGG
eukprot:73696-Prymnesium_polylepis.1